MSKTSAYMELPKNKDLKELREELNDVLKNPKTKALALKILTYLEGGEKEKKKIFSFFEKEGKMKVKPKKIIKKSKNKKKG